MIKEFQGKYRFLSNFYPVFIEYDGKTYPSVEHAYQAAKTLDLKERDKIRQATTPGQAKKLARSITLREDWDDIKYYIMVLLINKKFQLDPLKAMLLTTGNEELQEGNMWGDIYWGIDLRSGVGENNLGKILMMVRGRYNKTT